MKKIVLIILGLIAIIALSYGCFFMKKDRIKDDLLSKAQSTYKISQMDWVHPTIKGENLEITRVLKLSGNAPSQEAKDEAEKIASSIKGLSGIDNQITVLNGKERESIQNPNIDELANSIIEEESQIEEDTTNRDPQLNRSEINLENRVDPVSSVALNTKEEKESSPQTLESSPYTFSASKNKDGNLLLNGFIGTQEEYDNIISLAKKLFGENKLKNDLQIAHGSPKGWSEMVELSINKLNDIDYGDIKITDSNYVFNAHVSSDKEKQAFLNDIKAKLSTPNNQYIRYQGDYIITAPTPIQPNEIQPSEANIENIIPQEENIRQEQSNISCQEDFNTLLRNDKIHFRYNQSIIKRSSYPLLNALAEVAKRCEDVKIVIAGYTDSIGSRAYNKSLSRKRAKKVKNYLIRRGVSRYNLRAVGYGESNPIADNFHQAGRAKNRRIEFKIEGVEK